MAENHAVDYSPLTVRLEGRARFCADRGEVKTPDLLREALERISSLEEENRRMREALEQSLRQWKMYAELEDERDLEAEVTPEADLYRLARAALSQEIEGERT